MAPSPASRSRDQPSGCESQRARACFLMPHKYARARKQALQPKPQIAHPESVRITIGKVMDLWTNDRQEGARPSAVHAPAAWEAGRAEQSAECRITRVSPPEITGCWKNSLTFPAARDPSRPANGRLRG